MNGKVWFGFSWREESERHASAGEPICVAEGTPVSAQQVSLAPPWYVAPGGPPPCSGWFYSQEEGAQTENRVPLAMNTKWPQEQRDDLAAHTQKGSEHAPSPAHGLEIGSDIECRCFCRRGGARVGCPCRGEGKESRD